jgi:ferric iron reductase protein FhuF
MFFVCCEQIVAGVDSSYIDSYSVPVMVALTLNVVRLPVFAAAVKVNVAETDAPAFNE